MPLFVTSRSQAVLRGIYAEQRRPQPRIVKQGTGVVGLVGQFPWGPTNVVIEPSGDAERNAIIAPVGMDRSGQGYLATAKKAWPELHLVRVLGSAAVKASAALLDSPTEIVTVEAKYAGTAGNSIDCVVAAASDGDANHFNLTVRVSNADGYTEDVIENVNFSGVGADSEIDLTSAKLIGSIVKENAGRPDNGTTTMTSGANGTIDAGRYVGTAGAPDHGISLFENDRRVSVVFADDCGNSLRAAVNAGLTAHANLLTDRIALLNGNSGQARSAIVADKASYISEYVAYCDVWYRQYDERGNKVLVPPTSVVASVMAQTSPSTSIAWKDPSVIQMFQAVVELETPRGIGAGTNATQGIITLVKEEGGGHSVEADVLTVATLDPSKSELTRTRMGIYIAKSLTTSLRSISSAPNVPLNRQLVLNAVSGFLNTLKKAANTNPDTNPHILGWAFGDIGAFNPQEDLDAGDFTVPLEIKLSSGLYRIFLSMRFGATVEVALSEAA